MVYIDGQMYQIYGRRATENLGDKLRFKDMFESNNKLCSDAYGDLYDVNSELMNELRLWKDKFNAMKGMHYRNLSTLETALDDRDKFKTKLKRARSKRFSLGPSINYTYNSLEGFKLGLGASFQFTIVRF